jgi:PAS domain S-box-containing protein
LFTVLALSGQPAAAESTSQVTPPQNQPAATRVLTVGVYADSFPYCFTDEHGQLTGFSVDLTDALARKMNVSIKRVARSPDEVNRRFQAGEFDFLQMLRESSERAAWVDFSIPYVYADQAVFLRRTGPRITQLSELSQKRLAINRTNSTAVTFVQTMRPMPEILPAADAPEALQMLEDGRADAAFLGRKIALSYIQKLGLKNIILYTGPLPRVEQRLGYAVHKGDQELLGKINESLAMLYHTGEFAQIHDKWFGRLEPKRLTREESLALIAGALGVVALVATGFALRQRRLARRIAEQETALKNNERIFRDLFNNAQVGMLRSRLDGSAMLNVNDKLLALFGWSRAEVLGNNALIHWADPAQRDELIRQLKADQRVVDFECHLRTKQGDLRVCLASLSLYPAEGIIEGSLIDITERQQATDLVRQQANFVRSIFDSNPAHLAVLDERGTIVDVNAGWRRFGLENDAPAASQCWLGTSYFQESPGAPIDEFARRAYIGIREVQQGVRTEFGMAYPCHSPSEQRFFMMRVVPLAGRPGFVVVSHTDETARRRAEQDLLESERRYRLVSENSSDVIWLFDLEQKRFSYVSPSVQKLRGFTADEVLGQRIEDALTAESSQLLKNDLALRLAAFSRGDESTRTQTHEIEQLRKDGTLVPTEVATTLITDNQGRVTHIQGVTRDITLRRQAEADRLILSKLESTGILAGGIAHDFNNLLTAILLGVDICRAGGRLDEPARASLDDVRRSVFAARKLTQQLITFAHGGAPLIESTDVAPLVRNSARIALSGSTVALRPVFADDLWAAEVDAAQIGQVVRNLVLNAREAMPAGGTIEILTENIPAGRTAGLALPPRDYLRISITDHGTGIPEDVRSKIFDPYFSTKQRGTQKGMGLGLTICHSIIRQHHGLLTFQTVLNQGTTFEVYLPATRPLAATAEAPPATATAAPPRVKILLMDDDDLIRKISGILLERMNYEVAVAANGRAAVDLYAEAHAAGRPFHVVLLDLTVPAGMGGLEAMTHLRALDPGVKAVVMSGYTHDESLQNYADHGFLDALQKPFELDALQTVLTRTLGRSTPGIIASVARVSRPVIL